MNTGAAFVLMCSQHKADKLKEFDWDPEEENVVKIAVIPCGDTESLLQRFSVHIKQSPPLGKTVWTNTKGWLS